MRTHKQKKQDVTRCKQATTLQLTQATEGRNQRDRGPAVQTPSFEKRVTHTQCVCRDCTEGYDALQVLNGRCRLRTSTGIHTALAHTATANIDRKAVATLTPGDAHKLNATRVHKHSAQGSNTVLTTSLQQSCRRLAHSCSHPHMTPSHKPKQAIPPLDIPSSDRCFLGSHKQGTHLQDAWRVLLLLLLRPLRLLLLLLLLLPDMQRRGFLKCRCPQHHSATPHKVATVSDREPNGEGQVVGGCRIRQQPSTEAAATAAAAAAAGLCNDVKRVTCRLATASKNNTASQHHSVTPHKAAAVQPYDRPKALAPHTPRP